VTRSVAEDAADLFFDEQYFAASIELGRRTAAAALAAGWQL
jgi:hypothetical protein